MSLLKMILIYTIFSPGENAVDDAVAAGGGLDVERARPVAGAHAAIVVGQTGVVDQHHVVGRRRFGDCLEKRQLNKNESTE